MKKERRQTLSAGELELMKILWRRGSGTVRDVQRELRKKKKLAFNTVMTFLVRMYNKGYVSRKKMGGLYVYSPKVNMAKILKEVASRIINKVFDGSLDPLVTYIAESRKLSPEQIQQLKKLTTDSGKRKDRKRGKE